MLTIYGSNNRFLSNFVVNLKHLLTKDYHIYIPL